MAKDETNGIPDALGAEARAQLLASRLAKLQQDAFELETAQIANNASDDDQVPGASQPQTYGQRRQLFVDAQERLLETYPEIATEVRSVLAGDQEA